MELTINNDKENFEITENLRVIRVLRGGREMEDRLKNVKRGEVFRMIPADATDTNCDQGWWIAHERGSVSDSGVEMVQASPTFLPVTAEDKADYREEVNAAYAAEHPRVVTSPWTGQEPL